MKYESKKDLKELPRYDRWLIIQALNITNADIHWVRHAWHHYKESYQRLTRSNPEWVEWQQHMKDFEEAERTLIIYVYGRIPIQKAWEIAGNIVECLYDLDVIPVCKLEYVLMNQYGLRDVKLNEPH